MIICFHTGAECTCDQEMAGHCPFNLFDHDDPDFANPEEENVDEDFDDEPFEMATAVEKEFARQQEIVDGKDNRS